MRACCACATTVYQPLCPPRPLHIPNSPLAHCQCDHWPRLRTLLTIVPPSYQYLPAALLPASVSGFPPALPCTSQPPPARLCILPQPEGSVPDGVRPPLSAQPALALSTLTTTGLLGPCTHLREPSQLWPMGPSALSQMPPLRFSYHSNHSRRSLRTNNPVYTAVLCRQQSSAVDRPPLGSGTALIENGYF